MHDAKVVLALGNTLWIDQMVSVWVFFKRNLLGWPKNDADDSSLLLAMEVHFRFCDMEIFFHVIWVMSLVWVLFLCSEIFFMVTVVCIMHCV